MSKFSKILISLSFAFIVAFSFMFTNLQPLFAKADSISTYNVSFIAPDNSLLYNVNDIPSGYSLQDLEDSNMLQNPLFLDYTYNGSTYSFSDWIKYSTNLVLTPSNNILIVNNSSQYALNIQQRLSLDVGISDVTFLVCDEFDNLSYRIYSVDSDNKTASLVSTTNNILQISYLDCFFGTSGQFQVNVYVKKESSVNIKYCSLVLGSIPLPYFSSSYLSDLLSQYNFSNYYYQYDINLLSAITSDKYFYPNKVVSNVSSDWLAKKWGVSDYGYINTGTIWTDGTNYYCSNGNVQLVLDISTSNWVTQYWNGLTNFTGMYVWSDGVNYYYSNGSSQYVLNTLTSTWSQKTWNGLTNFNGMYVWSDGTNYYYSDGSSQYVLNVSTSTWSQKTWIGLTNFTGTYVWSDGINYYYSGGSSSVQYVLDILTSTWSQKTWTGLSYFQGAWIWTDGTNYYYSNGSSQYVLNTLTSTWSQKTWSGDLTNFSGTNVWYSDFGIFYSYGNQQYVFGSSLLPLDSTYYYNNGYDDGYDNGYNNGYDTGYTKGYYFGIDEAGNYTFFSLISAVIDAPIKTITGLFNFDLLGVNLLNLFTGLITLAILLFVIKLVLGGK